MDSYDVFQILNIQTITEYAVLLKSQHCKNCQPFAANPYIARMLFGLLFRADFAIFCFNQISQIDF